MTSAVVDENVAIVANDFVKAPPLAPQADAACRLHCVRALRSLVKSGIVVIDTDGEVLNKYRQYLDFKGQPGSGDAFYKHVANNQFNPKKVRRIQLTRNEERLYDEFPEDHALHTFDRDDRIFVALALTANSKILNAVDSDYRIHDTPLKLADVKVQELCPHCLNQ